MYIYIYIFLVCYPVPCTLSFLPSHLSGILYILFKLEIKKNRNIYTQYKIQDTQYRSKPLFFLNYLIKACFDICIYLLIQIFYSKSFYRQKIQLYNISLSNIISNNCLKLYS